MNEGVLCKYVLLGRDGPLIEAMRRHCAISQNSCLIAQLQSKKKSMAECCINDVCQPFDPCVCTVLHTHSLSALVTLEYAGDKYFVRTRQ